MAETLKAEIDFKTHEAFANLTALVGVLDKTDEAMEGAAKTADKLEEKIADVAEATAEANKEITANKDKIEQLEKAEKKLVDTTEKGSKATAEATDKKRLAKSETSELSDVTNKTATSVMGLISSYVGFQTVIDILDKVNESQRNLLETRNRLVGGKLDLSSQLKSLQFNLGIPQTPQGEKDVLNLVKEMTTASPGTSINTMASVMGAGASFQFDSTKAGPDRQVMSSVASFSERLGFDPETSANMVRLLAVTKNRTPEQANKMLAQFEGAAKTSPIENPAEFARSFLRAALPLIQGGMSFGEAAGTFSAIAGPEPSAERAATNVEQFSRIVRGTDDKSMTALAQRAVKAGLISQKEIDDAAAKVVAAVTPETQDRLEDLNRTIANAEKESKAEQADFARDIAENQRKTEAAKRAGKETASHAAALESRKQQNVSKLESLGQRVTEAKADIAQIGATQGKKTTEAAAAEVWRGMGMQKQFQTITALGAAAKSPQELDQLLISAGATAEEARAARSFFVGGGPQARAATEAAVASASGSQVETNNRQYQATDLAKQQTTENRALIREVEAIGSPEMAAERFATESVALADEMVVKGGGRPAALSKEEFESRVMADELIRLGTDLLNSISIDEGKANESAYNEFDTEIGGLIAMRNGGTYTASQFRAAIMNAYRKYYAFGQTIANWRAKNPKASRTPTTAKNDSRRNVRDIRAASDKARGTKSDRESMGLSPLPAETFTPNESPAPATATPPAGETPGASAASPAAAGQRLAAGPRSVYNVNIGQVISRGGSEDFNFLGRMEGEA